MSDGVMTYEDWLRGCVHHDGRHGYVTLPCDEVLKIADFIERLRAIKSAPLNEWQNFNNYTVEMKGRVKPTHFRIIQRTQNVESVGADRKTEPQTYVINPQEPTNDDKCFECDDFFTCGGQCNKVEDEPQTEGASR